MRSMAPFRSMPMRVSSMSADFEHSVLASRLNSWQRKSNLRPTGLSGRASFRRLRAWAMWAGQPVEFLAHVGLADQQRHFLREALLRQGGARSRRSASWLSNFERTTPICATARSAARWQSPSISVDMPGDHAGQRLALAGPGIGQPAQHLVERARQRLVEGGQRLLALLALVFLLDDSAHAQQPVGRRRRGAGALAHFLDQYAELGEQRAIDAQRLGLAFAADRERERDVAALQLGAGRRTGRILQALEALRHPAADL
jgi:hypothetical protein